MARSPKHWTLKTYSNDTWTDLVPGEAVITGVIITNTGAPGVAVSLRLVDGTGTETAILVPTTTIAGNYAQAVDFPRSLSIQAGTKLQVRAAAAGIHFTATGLEEA